MSESANVPMVDLEKALAVLRRVFDARKMPKADQDRILHELAASDFERWTFDSNDGEIGEVLSATLVDGVLVIRAYFAGGEWQMQARFTPDAHLSWRLASLKSMCPACFGDGDLDGAECYICDGTGFDS